MLCAESEFVENVEECLDVKDNTIKAGKNINKK